MSRHFYKCYVTTVEGPATFAKLCFARDRKRHFYGCCDTHVVVQPPF